MKWHRFRWVRAVTVAVPCVWFLYVVLTFFIMAPSSTQPPHQSPQRVVEGGGQGQKQHREPLGTDPDKDDATVLHEGLPRHANEKHAVNVHDGLPRRDTSRTALNLSKDRQDSLTLDMAKLNVARMAMRDPRNSWQNLREDRTAEKNRHDVSNDVMKGESDVDLYANVTFPPYVETLPAGAEGQGPEGLIIDESSLPWEQQRDYREKWNRNQFSQYVSDLIPVHRELPDYRNDKCRSMQYPLHLSQFSVVMVFHNEAWSTLLRSVHSILDRTPPRLLREIILVDDFSSMEHLKRPLDKYFLRHPKVKIARMPQRGGLIRARLHGFKVSSGKVVVFLDSHIECTIGWAEPLLWVVSQDYRAVPFPVIDTIHARKLTYMKNEFSPFGVFSMDTLTFTWDATLKRRPHPDTGARPSPTMPGGLFAISRKWFEELGTYDPDLEYWGGENMELSFKTWMCGGSVVIADCSHVGHIFRAVNPVTWPRPLGRHNNVRVALVWMDHYREHYLERINYQLGDYGDVSDRLALRQSLKCQDFEWYVDNVYPELQRQLVFNASYAGEVRLEGSGLCLDRLFKLAPNGPWLVPCHQQGGHQFWYLRDDKYLQTENRYLCQTGPNAVGLCFDGHPTREWTYSMISRQLKHVMTGLCLQRKTPEREKVDKSGDVMLAPCAPSSPLQSWRLQRRKHFKYR